RFRHERRGPAGPRVGLRHVEGIAGERELHVEQAAHTDAARNAFGRLADPGDVAAAEGDRRKRARGVAGVDAGFLDVLHHAAEEQLSPSYRASTSISIASSRNRSTSTG